MAERVSVLVIAALVISVSQAHASEWSCRQVSQPLGGTGAGTEIAEVLYVGLFNSYLNPATWVELTTSPNMVETPDGQRNLNMANRFGITVKPLPGLHSPDGYEYPGLYGDTLKVNVRIPTPEEWANFDDYDRPYAKDELTQIVLPATIVCLKENARRGWPRVKYLEIVMQGNADYMGLGGIFPLEGVVASPWPHDWRR